MPRRPKDEAAPPKPKTSLTSYEGKTVLSATVSITNAGDGLSKAMAVEPIEMHHGQRVQIVLDGVVEKIRYDKIPDTDGLQRVHIIKAGTATFIDEESVRDALQAQAERIEAAAGIHHLPLADNGGEGGPEADPDGGGEGDDPAAE